MSLLFFPCAVSANRGNAFAIYVIPNKRFKKKKHWLKMNHNAFTSDHEVVLTLFDTENKKIQAEINDVSAYQGLLISINTRFSHELPGFTTQSGLKVLIVQPNTGSHRFMIYQPLRL